MLFLLEGFIPFIGDALVKFGGAAFTFRDEVETDATDVFLGTEVLEIVDLLALDFKFKQTEVPQAHLVAHLQMTHHRIRYSHHQPFEHTTADAGGSGDGSLTHLKKRIVEVAVKVIVAALTAFLTAITTTSCMGLGPF